MPRTFSYTEVVNAAINDMLRHGFDSMARVQFWEGKLKNAIATYGLSSAKADDMLRRGLTDIYKRFVIRGHLADFHPGVSRFTVEKLTPAMRAELDRRIMASTSLIRLNRSRMVEQTLQRFSGWATSIPAGGSSKTAKTEKRKLKKSLTSLKFEERRLLIDQGHKLRANISEIVAEGGEAIAGYWHSHWREPGYDYRPDHKERDQECFLLKGSWAHERGLVKPGRFGYYGDPLTKCAEEPYCRCIMRWVYNLRDLPPDMLTAKGKKELEKARAALKAA